jgi:chloramphenicol 3-O phosphotransferase
MPAQVILLNGVGSVGKSSIAKAIQALATRPFLHVAMDAFLEMMPRSSLGRPEGLVFETTERNGKPAVIVRSGPLVELTLRAMRHAVAAMAGQGCNIVVDDVMLQDRSAEYRALLNAVDFRMVGVFAPLEVLGRRELARGDRAIGLARAQFDIVHKGVRYDLEVDTSAASPEKCARQVVQAFGL